jgi:plastocyanin
MTFILGVPALFALVVWAIWRERAAYVGYRIVFAALTAFTIAWLLIGLAPAIVATSPSLYQHFHEWGEGTGLFAELASKTAAASRNSGSALQVVLDYLFSALTLGLGLFLVLKAHRDPVARLLAIGMVGTAMAFNLQSHATRQIVGTTAAGAGWVDGVHQLVHVVAGVSYILALLLFPTGKPVGRFPIPGFAAVILVFTALSFIGIEDHTSGLVIVFGVFTPIAGIASQYRRFRKARTPQERQQSRLILSALGISFAVAITLILATVPLGTNNEDLAQSTQDAELVTPGPGTYVFACTPHPDMDYVVALASTGETAAGGEPQVFTVAAEKSNFVGGPKVLPADTRIIIRFTNHDGDAHNVALYERAGGLSRGDALYVGQEFSGDDLARIVFRIFRIVFAVIPIALFVGILRFRLWDIDHVVNRALVYTAVSGILVAVYGLGVLLLGRLLHRGNQNDLVVLGSTLGAALAVRPALRRMQAFVDRRFYRRKYDAAKTVATFNAHVRDHVDLDELSAALIGVVHESMEPQHVSLWLRSPVEVEREPEPEREHA